MKQYLPERQIGIVLATMMQLKKLFIIPSFFLLFVSRAAGADTFIEAMQVECIPELYHLKIGSHTVGGEMAVEYYEKHRDFFEKSMNLFDLSDVRRTHRITCAPPDGKYEVIIGSTYEEDENMYYKGTRTAIITVKYNGETLIDNLTLESQKKNSENIQNIIFNTYKGYYLFKGGKEHPTLKHPDNYMSIQRTVFYREKAHLNDN